MCCQLMKVVFWGVTPCNSIDSYCDEEYYCPIFRVEKWAMWENVHRQWEKTENNRTLSEKKLRENRWKDMSSKCTVRKVVSGHQWQLCCRQMALVEEWSQYTESCEWRHIKCRWAYAVSCKCREKRGRKVVSQRTGACRRTTLPVAGETVY